VNDGSEPTTVLVTGAGGPAAVVLIRAWNRRGDVRVLAADIDPVAAGLYLVPPGDRFLLRRGDDPAFVDHVIERCVAEGVDIVVPTVDAELLPLALRRADLGAVGAQLVVAGVETLQTCLDKAVLVRRCTGVVPVPRTEILGPALDLGEWDLPLVTKPRTGSGSRDVLVHRDLHTLASVPRSGELVIQEYLPGAEYSIDVLAGPDGQVLASVPRSRLKVDSGIAVAGRTHRDPELEAFGAAVAQAVGVVGVANVQARVDRTGKAALLEVNPRFPGSMVLTVAAGADIPALVLDAALGRPLPERPIAFTEVGMVRYWEDQVVPVGELAALAPPAESDAGLR